MKLGRPAWGEKSQRVLDGEELYAILLAGDPFNWRGVSELYPEWSYAQFRRALCVCRGLAQKDGHTVGQPVSPDYVYRLADHVVPADPLTEASAVFGLRLSLQNVVTAAKTIEDNFTILGSNEDGRSLLGKEVAHAITQIGAARLYLEDRLSSMSSIELGLPKDSLR